MLASVSHLVLNQGMLLQNALHFQPGSVLCNVASGETTYTIR